MGFTRGSSASLWQVGLPLVRELQREFEYRIYLEGYGGERERGRTEREKRGEERKEGGDRQ